MEEKTMVSYAPIFVTAILGLLGLVLRTQKRENPNEDSHWYDITIGGYIIGFLILFGAFFTCYEKADEKESLEKDKARLRNKIFIDSMTHRQERLEDSLRHLNMINKLNEQKILDSGRFNMTLSKFEQTQLRLDRNLNRQEYSIAKQFELFDQTENLEHPLMPLKIEIDMSIELDSAMIIKILDGIRELKKEKYPNNKVPHYVFVSGNEDDYLAVSDYLAQDTATYSSAFRKVNGYIVNEMMPSIQFDFFKSSTDSLNGNLAIQPIDQNSLSDPTKRFCAFGSIGNKVHIDYQCALNRKKLHYTITCEEPFYTVQSSAFHSLFDIKDGYMTVLLFSFTSNPIVMKLHSVKLSCGQGFIDTYWINFDDLQKTQDLFLNRQVLRRYYVSGADILTGRKYNFSN